MNKLGIGQSAAKLFERVEGPTIIP